MTFYAAILSYSLGIGLHLGTPALAQGMSKSDEHIAEESTTCTSKSYPFNGTLNLLTNKPQKGYGFLELKICESKYFAQLQLVAKGKNGENDELSYYHMSEGITAGGRVEAQLVLIYRNLKIPIFGRIRLFGFVYSLHDQIQIGPNINGSDSALERNGYNFHGKNEFGKVDTSNADGSAPDMLTALVGFFQVFMSGKKPNKVNFVNSSGLPTEIALAYSHYEIHFKAKDSNLIRGGVAKFDKDLIPIKVEGVLRYGLGSFVVEHSEK